MIKHIIFDLDGTLYSMQHGMREFFRELLMGLTASWLGISPEECEPIYREALKRHGTTLEWLTKEEGYTDKDAFMAHVHPEEEVKFVPDDPELKEFLEKLPLPCSVLTNSPSFHAERVIKKLQLESVFQRVFSIDDYVLEGKPNPSSYRRALDALGLTPKEAIFIDDYPRYVEGYMNIGGRGILLDETDLYKDYTGEKIKNLKELAGILNLEAH